MVGFIISFGIRCNVGVAQVRMMSNTTNEKGEVTEISEFHWSPETIGYVDASFFWGYIITQLPGGFLASRFPANRLFGTAIFLSSCLNLLVPAATMWDPKALIIVRVLQVSSLSLCFSPTFFLFLFSLCFSPSFLLSLFFAYILFSLIIFISLLHFFLLHTLSSPLAFPSYL